MFSKRSVCGWCALLALVLLAGMGCGKVAEKAAEKAIEVSAGKDGNDVKVDIDTSGGGFKMSLQGTDDEGKPVDVQMDGSAGGLTLQVQDESGEAKTMNMQIDKSAGGLNFQLKGDSDAEAMEIQGAGDDDSFTMTMDGMTMNTGANAKLPEDFPEDIPLYEGMKLTMVQEMPAQGATIVGATTPDSVKDVGDFYAQQLVEKGWNEQMSMNMGADQRMLNFVKDKRTLHVIISVEDGATAVHLSLGAQ